MSSRSLASARAKRTSEPPQRMSGNRPVTSIGSSAAFNNPPPQNGRQINYQQQQQQQQQPTPATKGSQPFKRLSISDAVGLITLRLGNIEQWIIDTEHKSTENGGGGSTLPDNSKIVDNSVFLSLIERINELEKNKQDNERVNALSRGISDSSKLVKSLIQKYETFVAETNAKFADYEFAIADLEQQIATTSNDVVAVVDVVEHEHSEPSEEVVDDDSTKPEDKVEVEVDDKFQQLDLKNEIEKEFLNNA